MLSNPPLEQVPGAPERFEACDPHGPCSELGLQHLQDQLPGRGKPGPWFHRWRIGGMVKKPNDVAHVVAHVALDAAVGHNCKHRIEPLNHISLDVSMLNACW